MKWERITDEMNEFIEEICQYCNSLCDCDSCWDNEKGICLNKDVLMDCIEDYKRDMEMYEE